ncbi:hypothetical protein CTAYLR_001743 [Chrysophaeum taylorii]|uniref:Uncharacterized protein n=1 Tax=Chrysophaeum taylorii TaxID=2483200 RepID=A0AAD7XJ75_9STRA|nr:hypothetical protein CTAYLR_001743 [Chrysophaeum taylorii]
MIFGDTTARYVDTARLTGLLLPRQGDEQPIVVRRRRRRRHHHHHHQKDSWCPFLAPSARRRPSDDHPSFVAAPPPPPPPHQQRPSKREARIARAREITEIVRRKEAEEAARQARARAAAAASRCDADDAASSSSESTASLRELLSDSNMDEFDAPTRPLVDHSASATFCSRMRNQLHKSARRDEKVAHKSATAAYVANCLECAVVPEPTVGKLLAGAEVDLRHMSMGDGVARTLASALPLVDNPPRCLSLADNRLGDDGIAALARGLAGTGIKTLDLSSNAIQRKGVLALAEALSRPAVRAALTDLSLERCDIGGQGIAQLANALGESSALRRLNVARNYVDEPAAEALAELVKNTSALAELRASWVNLRRRAAGALALGLADSKVKTADLSWNAWYVADDDDAAIAGLEVLFARGPLAHLDLSHSRIGAVDVSRLAKALEPNRLLRGLHMEGNAGTCNAYGFLETTTTTTVRPNGRRCSSTSNCWICEKWVEHRYLFSAAAAAADVVVLEHTTVALRASFDHFTPYPMVRKTGHPNSNRKNDERSSSSSLVYFELWRMVPPGSHQHTFVVGTSETTTTNGKRRRRQQQPKNKGPSTEERECIAQNEPRSALRGDVEGYARVKAALEASHQVLEANTIEVVRPPQKTSSESSSSSARCSPRDVQSRSKSKWTVEASAFAAYRADSPQVVGQAFDNDYAATNLAKALGAGEVEARAVLRENYGVIKNAFRQFSLSSVEVFAMGWNAFTELVLSADLTEKQRLARADVDMTFFTSSRVGPPSPRNTKKSLCRFQFLDAIVRLALKRWLGTADAATPAAAMNKLVAVLEAIPGVESAADLQAFHDRVWTEDTDAIVRDRRDLLAATYDRFSGKEDKPGQPKQMSLAEWMSFADWSGLSAGPQQQTGGDGLGVVSEREAKQAFCRASTTVADEMATDSHRKLRYVEFVEAILRVVDVIARAHHSEGNLDDLDDDLDATAITPAEVLRSVLEERVGGRPARAASPDDDDDAAAKKSRDESARSGGESPPKVKVVIGGGRRRRRRLLRKEGRVSTAQ